MIDGHHKWTGSENTTKKDEISNVFHHPVGIKNLMSLVNASSSSVHQVIGALFLHPQHLRVLRKQLQGNRREELGGFLEISERFATYWDPQPTGHQPTGTPSPLVTSLLGPQAHWSPAYWDPKPTGHQPTGTPSPLATSLLGPSAGGGWQVWEKEVVAGRTAAYPRADGGSGGGCRRKARK
ncbi:hypothetical protein EYF80_040090 [Liparis tanakae]|uniref:Uncharacterized protein n=1 Tax=Liparis tanakae TaxID=230148 RepID=A0A4Z2G864_9TELE|nr:hypothetical protein EYF80_040090 [Liparis tanakae]